ncbi:MAG: AI-2E family transporter [Marinobacter sp.]|nr:AI-2E family transporter [Marinobacter sp.]
MTPTTPPVHMIPRSWLWLFGLAAIVIIIGGLKAISHIITPFLLAAFMAIISIPPLSWMQRKGVPGPLAMIVLFLVVGFSFFLLFLALKNAVESLAAQAPLYQARLVGWLEYLRVTAAERGVPPELIPLTVPMPDAGTLTNIARGIAGGVGQFTAYIFFVLLAFMFLLMEERTMMDKLNAAFPGRRRARVRMRHFLRSVNRYLAIKTTASLATGLIVGVGLSILGVDFAILWGILAGLLNFIPTIGSIIAAIPAVLIALLGLGVTEAMIALTLYVVTNVAIGSIIEPRFMGQTLGLSPVIVLVSLLVWGWVFGPVGMLLSILLTMILKLALESSPQTRWLGILLSDRVRNKRRQAP